MYYKIRTVLEEVKQEEIFEGEGCYVAVISPEEWARDKEKFNMGIDLEFDTVNLFMTKAEVNYDSLTGSFLVPDRNDLLENSDSFAFALDEKGIVFIDQNGYTETFVRKIAATKKWRAPSLERFIYDFLEMIISRDLTILERYEDEINTIEDRILEGNLTGELERNNEIRGELLQLKMHYEQLIDLGQELSENENEFFQPDNIRFFELFTARVLRLQGIVSTLREYTGQVRELYQSELSVKQNRIMTNGTPIFSLNLWLKIMEATPKNKSPRQKYLNIFAAEKMRFTLGVVASIFQCGINDLS